LRKILLATLFLLLSTILTFGQIDSVHAQSSFYENIDIRVTLNEDGSAHIVERWKAHLYEGTENYLVKENLGKSTIENFTVTEDGQQYEFVDQWNIEASKEEKSFKNGIIETKDGVELSWGIGEYGTHEYVIEYTVTNIVKQLKDSQMLHWTFSHEGNKIPRSNIKVEIEAHKELNDKDENIWSFGYLGNVNFVQGNIIAKNTSGLATDDYVMLLVQFEDGTFTAKDRVNKKFKAIQKDAFAGSDYDLPGFFGFIFSIIKTGISFLIFASILIVLAFLAKNYNKGKLTSESPRTFRRQYKEEYYRDYPYKGNYLHAYYIVYMMGLSNFNTLLTAVLLKWIHEDRIQMIESTSGVLRRTRQTIHILNDNIDRTSLEGKLFHMLKSIANNEGMITDRDMAKWADRNHRKLHTWEKSVMDESTRMLKNENFLKQFEKKVLIFTNVYFRLTEDGKELEKNVYKYVNYLHDFSLLHEHEAINVKIWDEIMIWAAYLNLTSVVMKQFAKIYPKYLEETKFKEDTIRRTRHMTSTVEESRRKSEQRARSSGSGGRASRRGGGKSYGGGRGGGVR